MENFLSLPRSAKAGLAVLLAVALLGWGIVAYSSKRQHEDAKSLRQALATLDGKTETEPVERIRRGLCPLWCGLGTVRRVSRPGDCGAGRR